MSSFALIRVDSWALLLALSVGVGQAEEADQRVLGLLTGSVVGDALGGPVEFAKAEAAAGVLPGYRARPEERVEAADLRRLAETLPLLAYGAFRPEAEPYGQWSADAPAGTVTDDTRHKMVLIDTLRTSQRLQSSEGLTRRALAEAYLRFADRPEMKSTAGWPALCEDSMREFGFAARWELGERDPAVALPPSRMWGGLGTCCGQMTLPPLAAIYPGEPDRAYLAAYELAWFDNGEAKDLNAAVVAGLAHALDRPVPAAEPAARHAAWREMLAAMKRTDPLRYGEVEFMDRALSRSIDRATALAEEAEGSPGRLYGLIEAACPRDHAWEAKFLLIEAVAFAEFSRGEPLAAIHLALDFGEDCDSAAQLLGSWFGALYGPELFPEPMRRAVEARLGADYRESLAEWVRVLADARRGLTDR
ncbi:ADP-ribosylglycohydrolase [Planctomycetes bacterium MalM25]|nr:ADP-ribosylglycohydrolase [Planctomycetes bacterium MalM25]